MAAEFRLPLLLLLLLTTTTSRLTVGHLLSLQGFNVVPDAESIYALAVAFGHVGPPVRATRHSRYKAWSYLNGAVASITLDHAGHKVYGEDADVDRATVDFLARSSSLFAAQDPSSAAGSLVESDISMH